MPMSRTTGTRIPRKRGNPPIIVAMNVRDFPIASSKSFKVVCSGGCGEDVWVNKKLKRFSSKLPVLCLDCCTAVLEIPGERFTILSRACQDVMDIFTDDRGACIIPKNWRDVLSARTRAEYLALKATNIYAEGSSFVARARASDTSEQK